MAKPLVKLLLLIFALALFAAYTYLMPVPWPHMLAAACGDVVGSEVCRGTFTWYFWLYAGFSLGFLWLVLRGAGFFRSTFLLLLGFALFTVVQPFTISELSHIQTYSNELFIVGFYNWMAWMAMALAACLLWPTKRTRILKATALLTLIMTAVFTFNGRGSTEHISPIVGGLLVEQNWAMAKQGMLIWLCAGIIIAALAYSPFHNIGNWILRGKADWAVWKRQVQLAGIFLAIALAPLLSLPAGIWLNGRDIESAREYVDEFLPKLEAYYQQHKEYPDVLDKIGVKLDKVPRLLAMYDYLAYGTKGGFYLARPEKYCFIFPNPGKDFGYWSVTSARAWRVTQPEGALQDSYEDICDENQEDIHQELIAGHLGLPNPNDPLTALGVEAKQVIPMKRQTQAATPGLQQAIDELGYKDPSIYYQPPQPPAGAVLTPEALLEELKKQPLRTD